MNKRDLLEAIELLERLRALKVLWVDDAGADPVLEMSLFLLGRHLQGLSTTPTNLAQATTVPYTTATRRIADMQVRGLLDLRPRTKTGKSFSVHPSDKLIAKMTSFLEATRVAISGSGANRLRPTKRSSGQTSVASPSIAPSKLGFTDGVHVLVLDDPAYAISKPLQRELSYLMGGQVRFSETSIDQLRENVLENAALPRSKYDIVAVDLPMIAEFAARGILTPLDGVAADSNVDSADFVPAAWRGVVVADRYYAIPILINPQLLFYRQDLFAELQTPPPSTTQDVLRLARVMHKPGEEQYGVSWTGGRGAPVGQAFIQFLADFGQPVFELQRSIDGHNLTVSNQQTLRPMIDTERGRATARFMIDLLKVSAPHTLTMGWEGQVNLLREGRVAMAYEWASRAAQLSGFASARTLGFLPHPTGLFPKDKAPRASVAPVGGFAFGIPSNIATDSLTKAWHAIEWLASPEVIKLLVQHGGHVTPRISVAADPDVQQLSPMIAAVDQMARRGEIRLWPRAPVPSYSTVVSILGEEIHDMLLGRQTVEQALKRSQDRAEAI
ncbi:extracellular solute-binding protein [Ruegeria sp. 2205SS24-7]|uniref:extracellular solute-binding protein n=1 Tax=Ruegeria discodermiae TaxID=3064389 RepID=UPI002741D624|nr:extracellular solute-binding protein [Ruegeria sp. 2205SS24-7]MDP5218904.1 extracellular solute-binding protein [Ruegeria sp. 2205SS24-7]